MSLENSCREIATIIKKRNTAVFCGAGISYNSGLPIVSVLLKHFFSKLELTEKQQDLIFQSDLPFESIMEMTLRESGIDEIIDIFKDGTPNTNHIFIAKLAKEGYFKTIYTTNFDTLIENALENEGLTDGKEFKVYSSETDLRSVLFEDRKINVVKIHGSCANKEDMAITMGMIASNKHSEMRKDLLQAIFGGIVCEDVFILGYSCSDLDLIPLIESLKDKKAGIQYVDHQIMAKDGSDNSKLELISIKKEKNPFKHYSGTRYWVDTDELVKKLWSYFLDEEYVRSTTPETNWKNNIENWYFNSAKDSGEGFKHHISSRLLYAVGEFEEAIKHHRKAIGIAILNGNELAYAAETGNMGMALNAIGEYEKARTCFENSIPLLKRMGNIQGLSSQLQALGNLLHKTGENEKAITIHKEALQYSRMDMDENSISTILGNISNCYNQLGDLESAEKCLEEALSISRRIGNKQAESSQMGIIAYTYFQQGKIQQAVESCVTGIEIKKSIGDRQGHCQLLNNLISLYIFSDEKDKAKSAIEECLKLAESIGNKEVRMMLMMVNPRPTRSCSVRI